MTLTTRAGALAFRVEEKGRSVVYASDANSRCRWRRRQVAFRVDGSGPGLVLVHGTGGNSETNWSQVVGHLT